MAHLFFMDITSKKSVNKFRKIAVLEGWSFIALLFIAMPVKYLLGFPLLVKYVGWAHGVLFVLYMLFMMQAYIAASWKFSKLVLAFALSFVPFGTFWLDKQLKRELEM